MTKPREHKPGEDDTTQLSTPINAASSKLIIEEPPIDDEDTKKSRPITDVQVVPISENSSIVDAESTTSPSMRNGKSKS